MTKLSHILSRFLCAVLMGFLFLAPVPAFADSAASAQITVQQTGFGGTAALIGLDGSRDSKQIADGSSATFTKTYTEAGTYQYTVMQTKVDADTTMDNAAYTVYVYVDSENNVLTSAVVAVAVGQDGQKCSAITFHNTKKNVPSVKTDDTKKDTPAKSEEKKSDGGGNTYTPAMSPSEEERADQGSSGKAVYINNASDNKYQPSGEQNKQQIKDNPSNVDPSRDSRANSHKTGDMTDILPYVLIVCGAAVVIVLMYKRKKEIR